MTGLVMLAWLTDPWTYAIVGLLALLLFGKRLPEVGRSLGRGISEFKKGLRDVQSEIDREDEQPPSRQLRQPESTSKAQPRAIPPPPTPAADEVPEVGEAPRPVSPTAQDAGDEDRPAGS